MSNISKAPGVTAKEIDNSQTTEQEPTGIPAGIIGTAERGPAFVPTYFGRGGYVNKFGNISSEHFGSLAAATWLGNGGPSCLYLRVLGAGNCKARNANGTVTSAGFTVGSEIAQPNDIVGANPHANSSTSFGIEGRTYFLSALMSESNGSTIFSDAGIQSSTESVASAIDAVDTTNAGALDEFRITVPVSAGGTGKTLTVRFVDPLSDPGSSNLIHVKVGADDDVSATNLIAAFNGTADETAVRYRPGAGDSTNGIAGVSAEAGSTSTDVTIKSIGKGIAGNSINITDVNMGTPLGSVVFSGGIGGAVPIIRGVILAPSGVILHLSGNSNGPDPSDIGAGNIIASKTTTAGINNNIFGNKGGISGSLNLDDSRFVMIMNGFNGDDPYITASLDPTDRDAYIKNVMNTDPLQIEAKGHLLLSAFDIHPSSAVITGSGVVAPGHKSKGNSTVSDLEDVVFLLTSSIAKGEASANIPDYEDFADRFSAAATPFITSQKYGGRPYDLFKLIRLDDGEIDNRFFIQIENIDYKTDTSKYGTFDLVIRDVYTDIVEETYTGMTFDPSSENYIARAIGDQYTYFDFDNAVDAQKIVVEGSFPNKDTLFRVKLSDDLLGGNVPKNAIPVGFRGPGHLLTSGSLLCEEDDTLYTTGSLIRSAIQPPFPYAKNINKLTFGQLAPDQSRYWGAESKLHRPHATIPNLFTFFHDENGSPLSTQDRLLNAWTRYYPSHRTDRPPIFAKDLPGNQTSTTTLLDTDRFNYNQFSLENILVRTGSDTDGTVTIADSSQWASSSYVRSGIISTNDTNKTRALEPKDFTNSTNRTYLKFTVPVINGFDGVNIFNAEKSKLSYRATKMEIDDQTNQGGLNGPTIAAYRKAIDIMSSKTDADIQVLALPGQRHPSVTDHAITAVENRFDSLLVMDIEERDKFNLIASSSDQKTVKSSGEGGVSATFTVNDFKNRNLDTSFAAAYFPDVTLNINGTESSDIPPSVMALGAIAKTDAQTGVSFFAPAGSKRSVLDEVIDISGPSINTKELNELVYDADINPIIIYEGVNGPFINGQKTLLRDQSALDRVDVRRMLIDIRRRVKNVANTLLFEPNRESTLEKFTAAVNPIMASVRSAGGISRYKVVIDTTTTTQTDVENNTIRGKIFLQPVGAIEFVALDFEVNNTIS